MPSVLRRPLITLFLGGESRLGIFTPRPRCTSLTLATYRVLATIERSVRGELDTAAWDLTTPTSS